jgi:hypothetical protein
MSESPIVVNAKAGPDQWAAGARQAVLILGPLAGYAAANHMLKLADGLNLAIAIVGPSAALVSIVLGQLATRKSANQQAFMANKLSDDIAVVRASAPLPPIQILPH